MLDKRTKQTRIQMIQVLLISLKARKEEADHYEFNQALVLESRMLNKQILALEEEERKLIHED